MMTKMLFSRIFGVVAVFLTVLTLVTGASAAVVVQDLGKLDEGESGAFHRITADQAQFTAGEVISFQVSENAGISVVGTEINFPSVFGISDFGVELVEGTGPDSDRFSTIFPLATGVPAGGALTLSFAGLLDEVHYGLVFTGTLTSIFGGFYVGAFNISAVPLPPAVWLFLSALVGLVGVVRRRRKPMLPTGQEKAASGA